MFRSVNKAVALILQSSPTQGRLWKVALESQGFSVILSSPEVDILGSIDIYKPELALIDISSGTFNPFEISRQSAKRYPDASIIFTNHKRQKIYPSERQWAIRQKAADLIAAPKTFKALRAVVASTIEISGVPIAFNPKALARSIALNLKSHKASKSPKPNGTTSFITVQTFTDAFSPITGIIRDLAALPDVGTTASSPNIGQPPMFRGRAITSNSDTASKHAMEVPSDVSESEELQDDFVEERLPQLETPFPPLFDRSASYPSDGASMAY